MALGWDVWSRSPSRTATLTLSAFCLGIVGGPLARVLPDAFLLGSVCVLLASVLVVRNRRWRLLLAILFCFVLGLTRFVQSDLPKEVLGMETFFDRTVRVEGVVLGEVEPRIGAQQVTLGALSFANEPVAGRVLVKLSKYPRVDSGSHLIFSCRLTRPQLFEGFAYDAYLAARGIYGICYRPQYVDVAAPNQVSLHTLVLSLKRSIIHQMERLVPEPHASFFAGLLFGGSSSLAPEAQETFRRTGTSHILAASGFNVSLLTFVFLNAIIKTRLGRRRGILLTGALLVVYVIMAGATPAVTRAALMASMLLWAAWIRRRAFMQNIVLATLALMLLINPTLLFADVGFQLSFVATVAVLWFAPRLTAWGAFLPEVFELRSAFVGSLAAIILTLPLILWHFGSVSLVAPLVNLLVLPLIPLLLTLILIAVAVSIVSVSVGSFIALLPWAMGTLMLSVIDVYAALPFALVSPAFSRVLAVCVATILLTYFICKGVRVQSHTT